MPDTPIFHLRRSTLVALLGLALLLGGAFPAEALLFDDDLPRATRVRNLNLLAAGTVIAWGVGNWDYFQETPQAKSEGWFSRGTDEGGADKLGHVYTAYALSHAFAWVYREWDYPGEQAMLYGTLSALGTTAIMELGDSFSDYGFSYEDMLMNCLGAAAGYWLGTHPGWQQRLDLRMEYAPSLHHFEGDVVTDYQHIKYLVALKADGFDTLRDTPLSYLELHFGYYARDYDDYHSGWGDDDRERTVFVGLGLNVGKVIAGVWDTRLFNYLQLPYTYLPLKHSLDD